MTLNVLTNSDCILSSGALGGVPKSIYSVAFSVDVSHNTSSSLLFHPRKPAKLAVINDRGLILFMAWFSTRLRRRLFSSVGSSPKSNVVQRTTLKESFVVNNPRPWGVSFSLKRAPKGIIDTRIIHSKALRRNRNQGVGSGKGLI